MQSIVVQKGFLYHRSLPDFLVAQIPDLAFHQSDLAFKVVLPSEIWVDVHGIWKPYQTHGPKWMKQNKDQEIRVIVIEKEDHPAFPYEACAFISVNLVHINACFYQFKAIWAGVNIHQSLKADIRQCLKI